MISWKKEVLLWRLPDYLIMGVMAMVAAVIGHAVYPHCRPFSWDDPTIGYPFRKNTFPMYAVILAVIFVALVFLVGELLTRWRRPLTEAYTTRTQIGWVRSLLLHMNGWVLVQAYSIVFAFAIVNIAKLYAGRLRPDFLARLRAEGFVNDGSFDPSQATGPVCRAAREGRLSFPSGHAGTSFAGFVPPVLYLLGLTRQLHHRGNFLVATLCMLPLILPIAVAVSRTVDYRHNFDDVLCGSLVGSACAVFAVLFTFCASDTGEWTLRSHPVFKADYKQAANNNDGDGGEDPSRSTSSTSDSRSAESERSCSRADLCPHSATALNHPLEEGHCSNTSKRASHKEDKEDKELGSLSLSNSRSCEVAVRSHADATRAAWS